MFPLETHLSKGRESDDGKRAFCDKYFFPVLFFLYRMKFNVLRPDMANKNRNLFVRTPLAVYYLISKTNSTLAVCTRNYFQSSSKKPQLSVTKQKLLPNIMLLITLNTIWK